MSMPALVARALLLYNGGGAKRIVEILNEYGLSFAVRGTFFEYIRLKY